jgi:hypothetical protein
MNKKIIAVTCGLLISAVLLFGVMPVAAADSPTATAATQQAGKGQLLKRILSIQDQAKLEALLAKGVAAGKLTSDQATKIETFWTAHHAQFAKARIMQRILGVKDEAKLKAFLDKAVSAKKITADQEATIITLWETAHSK